MAKSRLMKKSRPAGMKKRLLSLAMALSLMLGMLPSAAFANGYENQVPDGYFTVNSENETKYHEGTIPNVEQDGYTVSKNIEQTGENAFDITLKVETSQTVKTNDAAVMLVIDTSGSMDYCAECGRESYHDKGCKHYDRWYNYVTDSQTRMTAAIAAAQNFVDSLVTNNAGGGSIYVSVVKFSTDAYKVCDWKDITTGNNADSVKTAIGQLKANGGTNLEAGLMLARNRLKMDAVSSASEKYTVLLTDGEPTFRVKSPEGTNSTEAAGTSDTGNNTNDNSGTECSEAERNEAVAMASQVKALGDLYTICYGVGEDILYGSDKCAYCGQPRSQHNKVDESEWWQWGHDYHYYCNTGGTEYEATSVTMAQYLENEIATPAADGVTYAFAAEDSEEINAAFADIASSVSEGSSGAGTKVIDPMGQFINFGKVKSTQGVDASFDQANKTLTWNLNPDYAEKNGSGGTTTYTFTLTYSITLDTAAKGFQENVNYPTNGYTRLTVPGGNDVVFNVPGVFGTIPEYGYRVEYYQQQGATKGDYDHYTKIDSDTKPGPNTDLWTRVKLADIDPNYETKYDNAHYSVAKADATITISANESANVIRVYYDRDTTSVTVNHYYKTDSYAADGTFTAGQYTEENKTTGTQPGFVGDPFTADKVYTYGGYTYDFDSGDDTIESLQKDAAENVINLYYTRTVDDRAEASVVVNHVYRTHTWTLENGKYILKTTTQNEDKVESSTGLKATTNYTAKTTPVNGFEDFTYNASDSVNSITLEEGENVITLYFDKTVDNREEVEFTVNHHYTKTVVTIGQDGQPVTTVEPNNHVEPVTVKAYKGETVTLSEQKTYNEELYTSDLGNAGKLIVTDVKGGEAIDLFYTIYQAPGTTSVTVNHIYRTITHETVVTTDPETGKVTGTDVVDSVEIDDTDEVTADNLYVGQSYTAEKKGRGGYIFNKGKSGELTVTVKADGDIINLYYDKDEDKDDRETASIDVVHVYTTHLTTIVNGKVKTIDVTDKPVTEPTHDGKAGDSFTAVLRTDYQDNKYDVVGTPDLDVILQPGTNDTIVINYERSDNNLLNTTYTVNYVYNTYTMVVEDGVVKYGDPVVATENGTAQSGYVDQIVTIRDGAREGFTAAANNPATQQTLTNGENVYTFVYNKYVPLDKVSVTVNHHYTTTTIAVDGTSSSSTSDVPGTPVEKYVGEDYVAQAVPNGFTYDRYAVTDGIANTQDEATKNVTVTASGNVVVNFYYSKTVDNSKPVTYTIRHIYKTIDWNGTVSTTEGTPISGNSYATLPLSANVDDNGGNYALKTATFNGSTISGFDPAHPQETYQVILVDGTNEIIYTYERRVDTREETAVQVTYNYFARDTYTDVDTMTDAKYIAQEGMAPEYTVVETITSKANGVWVGHSYTATGKPNYTVGEGDEAVTLTYTFVSANPEGGKVDSLLALYNGSTPDGNKIVMNYIRKYSTETRYTVIHEYYTNGSLSGSTQNTLSGQAGATVNAADIAKVTSYEGNTYSYTSASAESITLAADGSSTITLRYDRSTGGGSGSTYYTVTVNYYDQDTGAKIATSYSDRIREGRTYDVSAYDAIDIEGYTYVKTTGDALSGTMNGSKVINVYYSSSADIEDPDVPGGELPDPGDGTDPGGGTDPGIDITDPEVPSGELPDVPETGDNLTYWVMAAAVSGLGVVWLAITGKKRKDETEG